MFKKSTLASVTSLLSIVLFAGASQVARAAVVDLQDKSLAPNSFYNGSDNAGGFNSGGAHFNNTFTDFGGGFTGWEGWSYSNVVDATTPGFGNQYAAAPGGGSALNGATVPGGNYAVGFAGFSTNPYIDLQAGQMAQSVRLSNTTYAELSLKNGDPFAKKFGGVSGNDADFFKVTITGYTGTGGAGLSTGAVDFYLADYRFADNTKDYIVNDWELVDLSSLGAARSLSFSFASSDNGPFGINTPTYVALDNLVTSSAATLGGSSVPLPPAVTAGLIALLVAGAFHRKLRVA